MTAIIVNGFNNQNFSIWQFYISRARRILPVFIAVVMTLLTFTWFWLPTPDYQALGKQSAYGLSFISNIYYWIHSGYFDTASKEKWLLHTWSIAVEAQFYLLYPIFISFIWWIWRSVKAIAISVAILFCISLILNIVVSNWQSTTAFYLLPTRLWELAAGALVFLFTNRFNISQKASLVLYLSGWLLLIASFLFIDESLLWPSYWAILPVLATSLIILVNNESCSLTNHSIAQWFGDRSYSLYLWHWPLIVTLYFLGLQANVAWITITFLLSILLAHFSYQLIERPSRYYLTHSTPSKSFVILVIASISAMLLVLFVSFQNLINRGADQTPTAKYLSYFSVNNYVSLHKQDYLSECSFFDGDTYTARTKDIPKSCIANNSQSVFLWGDSHAAALSHGLRLFLQNNYPNTGFSQVTSASCRPHLMADTKTTGEVKKSCHRSNRYALKALKKIKPKMVIMAQRDEHNENNLIEIAQEIRKQGVQHVVIVGPVPQWNIDLPRLIARHYWTQQSQEIDDPNFKSHLLHLNSEMKELITKVNDPNIAYASPIDYLCASGSKCKAILNKERTPLVFDYGHLTKEGSNYVVHKILAHHLDQALAH